MSEIKIDVGDIISKEVPTFISISSSGAFMILLSLILSFIGFTFNRPMLFIPGAIMPITFLIFLAMLSRTKNAEIKTNLILSNTQIKAKTFLPVLIEISSPSKIRGLITLETSDGLFGVLRPPSTYISLEKNQTISETFLFYAPKRGSEKIERLIISFNGILGLFSLEKRIVLDQKIIILPEPQRIQLPWKLKQHIFELLVAQISIPIRGRGNDFLALKDFEFGDEIRHISWKATAKFNKIISKEFEEPIQLRFLLIVDSSLFMTGPKLEFALSSIVEFVSVIRRSEHSVHVLVHGDKTYKNLKISSSPATLRTLGIELHNVVPEGAIFNYESLYDTILTRKLTNTVVFLLTDPELPINVIQNGLTKIRKYIQRLFFITCYTPGFGTLAYSKIRDEYIDNIDQYEYRKEIIEPKISRNYKVKIDELRKAVVATNSKFHVIETYNTNILLEIKAILDQEVRILSKTRVIL